MSSTTPARPHFDVDPKGLAQLFAGRDRSFAVCELVQNAWDQDVTGVTVIVEPIPGKALARIVVEDDDPNGFADLAHAYTLFADSAKKTDVSKRGRFNLGEKLAISLCVEASISTTTGTVTFDAAGRRHYPRRKRDVGSRFEGLLRLTRAEYADVERAVSRLIPPAGISTTFNGAELAVRQPVLEFGATLGTVLSDAEGVLRPTRRKTIVRLYEPLEGDAATLYELGIPVVQTGDRFDVDVQQKVPLNTDRDNVTPAYLRELRARVLDETHHLLDAESAAGVWVAQSLEDPDLKAEAVSAVLDARYGPRRVIYDPNDIEGSKLAVSAGYAVIHGGSFNARQWESIKRAGAALPAGQVTPSPQPYSDDPNAPVRQQLDRKDWTPGMVRVTEFCALISQRLTGVRPRVLIINDRAVNAQATYGYDGQLHVLEFNVAALGQRWFDQSLTSESVLSLLIHELGHHYSADHLSSAYYQALSDLGARLAALALTDPELFI